MHDLDDALFAVGSGADETAPAVEEHMKELGLAALLKQQGSFWKRLHEGTDRKSVADFRRDVSEYWSLAKCRSIRSFHFALPKTG
jgi:hypothetical protein